jgi:hypothetical protein
MSGKGQKDLILEILGRALPPPLFLEFKPVANGI